MKKVQIEIPMKKDFSNVKNVTLEDKLSDTFTRPTVSLIGKFACVNNALLYIISDKMPIIDVRKPYEKIKGRVNTYLRHTHNVKHYYILERIFITDSILRDKNLVIEILTDERLRDLDKVDFIPILEIKSKLVVDKIYYNKRKSYAISVKKVIREIYNVFNYLEKTYREAGDLKENEKLDPNTIANFKTDDYKVFKNEIKSEILEQFKSAIGEDENIMEGVRNAKPLTISELEEIWLR